MATYVLVVDPPTEPRADKAPRERPRARSGARDKLRAATLVLSDVPPRAVIAEA